MTQKTFLTPAYESISKLQAYQTGKSVEDIKREDEVNDVLKLASNENPLGSSPYVTLAITKKLDQLARYPDGNGSDLKQAVADFNDVDSTQVTLGNGSNDLLDIIARTFVSHNDAIVYSEYSFIVYSMLAKMIGATGIEVPAKRYGHDLEAMLEAVQQNQNVRMVFIANPNNPTGTLLSKQDILHFVEQVPSHVLIVLDEAYIEYCPESNNRQLIDDFDNVIIVRTFSKAYGLAGLRVGYALSHPNVANLLNRIRQPFNVSLLAQSAAVAALADQDFIAKVHKINDGQMRWICKQFDALGLGFVKSYANFVMVNVGDAAGICQALLQQGVIVRPLADYGLDEWLRITVGTPEDNTRLIDTLRDTLESM
ncbi:histidinol-phosphate transaminase [Psychrobacter sanguinis]|uniref:histidinol-phosphate transaminase n=1 Tax=Psychrobacter sanguinis TaxID=861445 RepID=UPI0019189CF8|nr:histidinol-phosphate transaminase [Psychrobacter sanguinis]UEC25016.1 histidinol-phosphate transaminase [Psychrobacter sanguinis]